MGDIRGEEEEDEEVKKKSGEELELILVLCWELFIRGRGRGACGSDGGGDHGLDLYDFQISASSVCFLSDSGLYGQKLKIIPVQVVPKPNGKLRIILDLSSPHLKKNQMKPGVACSVNAGIVKEDYPATMATTRTVLRRLYEVGSGVHFSKIDWKAAYKHFGVR